MENVQIPNFVIYVIFFVAALIFATLINRLFLKFSRTLGIRNLEEDAIRWAPSAKPALGGLSFYIIFLLAFSFLTIFSFSTGHPIGGDLVGLLLACTVGFMVGLADDAYNTNPLLKAFAQFTCANILITMGIIIEISPFMPINYFFTIVWVIGMMNSINMLDNMDGIATVVAISATLAALLIVFILGDSANPYVILLLGVLAALIGFLIYNWNPSKMYMGDTGSQFLGVYLAAISIIFFWNYRDPDGSMFQIKQFLIPIVIFMAPFIDTLTVVSRRILRGQSPFVGGSDHITHHFGYLGMSDRSVALIIALICTLSLGVLCFILVNFEHWTTLGTIGIILYLVVVFGIVQYFYSKGKTLNEARKQS